MPLAKPATQRVQAVEPLRGAANPAEQAVQDMEPASALARPAVQLKHWLGMEASPRVPGPQAVQRLAPAAE
jgi:hypothetical protein